MVAFAVPRDVREAGPGGEAAAICPRCLALVEAGEADRDADFSRIVESFPEGEAGAVMAIAVGLLVDSLALHRQAIASLIERAQDEGVDPWLLLERLDVAPTVRTDADVGRARVQLEQLLEE